MLGITLVEVLHDHLGLGQHEAVVEHRHRAARRVQVETHRGRSRRSTSTRLVLEVLLGERDPHARAVRAARGVDQLHGSSPISARDLLVELAGAGGSSAGEAAVRATRRTSSRSAPVSRATSVGFAASASSSPFGSSP